MCMYRYISYFYPIAITFFGFSRNLLFSASFNVDERLCTS